MFRTSKPARQMFKADPEEVVATEPYFDEASGGGSASRATAPQPIPPPPADDMDEPAAQALLQDIDAILVRLEIGIAAERIAMNALLERLASPAA